MGKGNYWPIDGNSKDFEMVYVDLGVEDYDELQADLVERLLEDGLSVETDDYDWEVDGEPDVTKSELDRMMMYEVSDLAQMNYDDFIADLSRHLPDSFYAVDRTERGYYDYERIVLQNGLFEIRLADNEWSLAVIVTIRHDDYHPTGHPKFAEFWLSKVASKFFDSLKREGYRVYVRSGAWTSSPYMLTKPTRYVCLNCFYETDEASKDNYNICPRCEFARFTDRQAIVKPENLIEVPA